ncbi:DEKNAAC102790 [Brettanomyces naardenensis]|uniref:DEKNAAC102790 n=1 Tax=Brettanomyces naardenensis TaxID=13370 RepID=A0A448YKH9_BRENA|nr:DEKNAAC102790 [Brettanomyces naardenensis]
MSVTKKQTDSARRFHVLDAHLQTESLKAVKALQEHLQLEEGSQHQPVYLVIDTKSPTAQEKQFTPRIIPLPNRIGKVGDQKIFLVTKDPVSHYREPIAKKGSPTEDSFGSIVAFQKFRSIVHSRKSAAKLYHDNDLILIDHRLHKLLPPLLRGTIFEKSNKKYPIMLQMARPSMDAKLVQSKKSTKMKDERVDPEYIQKQVRMICRSTTFVPSKGSCISIIVGYSDMSTEKLVENIDSVLEYLTDVKFAPVGGIIKGMDRISDLHVKLAESVTLPIN